MHCKIEFLVSSVEWVNYMKHVFPMFLRPGGGPLFFESEFVDDEKLLFCVGLSYVLDDYLKPIWSESVWHTFTQVRSVFIIILWFSESFGLAVVIAELHLTSHLRLPNLERSCRLLIDRLVRIDSPVHSKGVIIVVWLSPCIVDRRVVTVLLFLWFSLDTRATGLPLLRQIWRRVVVLPT